MVFNNGHTVRGGRYLIVINSGGGDTGIHDVAGNALDGNFYGTFPSGDGLPGGNFAASIDTFHNNIVLPPVPFLDGYVPPSAAVVDPPAVATAQPRMCDRSSGRRRRQSRYATPSSRPARTTWH